MNKMISVIVPVYNSEKYIRRCLISIVEQSYSAVQIICVDDGSTDGSKNIINELRKDYKNIEYVYEENHGPSYARNNGIKLAKGEYITFVDSDDFLSDKNCFSDCLTKIQDYDILIFDVGQEKKAIVTQDSFMDFILMNDLWGTCGKIVKKNHIKKFFNEKSYIGEDLKFWYDNRDSIKNYLYVNKCYYNYTNHDNSIMHSTTIRREIVEYFEDLYKLVMNIANKKTQEKMALFYIYSYYTFFKKDTNGYIKTKKELVRLNRMANIVFMSSIDKCKKIKARLKVMLITIRLRDVTCSYKFTRNH